MIYIKDKINPHLYKINSNLEEYADIFEFEPKKIIWDKRRFDLAVKYNYLIQKNKYPKLKWPKKIYYNHISSFTNQTFIEGDYSKRSFEDYFNNYNLLEEKIKGEKYDSNQTLIPFSNGINVDGSHRISLAAYYNKKLKGVNLSHLSEPNYDYNFFRKNGQSEWINDFTFLQHIKENENIRIIHIHPKANIKNEEIISILLKHEIKVEYHKDIFFSKFAHGLIVREFYKNENWIGNHADKFIGAFNHSSKSFTSKKPFKLLFINEDDLNKLRIIKSEIRAICNIGNYSVHINDTYKETLELSNIFLNSNSISFLNSCINNKVFWKTDEFLLKNDLSIDSTHFVIVGSFPLALIGLRENRDIDIICNISSIEKIQNNNPSIDIHNNYLKQFRFNIEELLSDPTQSFYWQGLRFLSLNNLWGLKKQRKEKKDYFDKYLFWILKHTSLNTNFIYKNLYNLNFRPKLIARKILGKSIYEKIKMIAKNK